MEKENEEKQEEKNESDGIRSCLNDDADRLWQ